MFWDCGLSHTSNGNPNASRSGSRLGVGHGHAGACDGVAVADAPARISGGIGA